uniref:Uncharacterized protein n=1 Tax=Rhizophora mucronata TaxID=61149 RepID=A0A2P2N486_RHIMU
MQMIKSFINQLQLHPTEIYKYGNTSQIRQISK